MANLEVIEVLGVKCKVSCSTNGNMESEIKFYNMEGELLHSFTEPMSVKQFLSYFKEDLKNVLWRLFEEKEIEHRAKRLIL